MNAIRLGIIILTLATAAAHLRLAFLFPSPDPIFLLNGIGYIGLLAALYLPIRPLVRLRALTRPVLIAYAALTFVLYFVINGFSFTSFSLADKIIEVVLIMLLLVEGYAGRRATA